MSERSKRDTKNSKSNDEENKKSNGSSKTENRVQSNKKIEAKKSPDEKLVEELQSITGLSKIESIQLLELCDNNLEAAINMQIGVDCTSSKGTTSRNADLYEEEVVRAPIPQKSEKLLDYDPYALEARSTKRVRSVVFDGFCDLQQEFDETEYCHPSKKRTLAELFRRPKDILFSGSFDLAKKLGTKMSKWILLNVQKGEEFECQVLNRDVWSDETVKEIIKANFLFIQVAHQDTEGQRLINIYSVNSYPFVAIIDPRTGEKMTNWLKTFDSAMFCELVTNFLSDHELPLDTSLNNEEDDVSIINSTASVSGGHFTRTITNLKNGSNGGSHKIVEKYNSSKAAEVIINDNDDKNKLIFESDSEDNESSDSSIDYEPKKKLLKAIVNNKNGNNTKSKLVNNNFHKSPNKITNNPIESIKSSCNNLSNKLKDEVLSEVSTSKPIVEEVVKVNLPSSVPKQIKYETNTEKKDCCLRIMMPNGDRLDFFTDGDAKLKLLTHYLENDGYSNPKYELIERTLPNIGINKLIKPIENSMDSLILNQSRNLFCTDFNLTFKQLNLYPRVFLLLQEC